LNLLEAIENILGDESLKSKLGGNIEGNSKVEFGDQSG